MYFGQSSDQWVAPPRRTDRPYSLPALLLLSARTDLDIYLNLQPGVIDLHSGMWRLWMHIHDTRQREEA